MKRKLLIILLSVITFWGCKKEEKEEVKPQDEPWEVDILMGNFSINSKDVVTNQDGVSLNQLSDYVSPDELPSSNFEFFTLNAYVPTAKGYSTNIKNVNVELNLEGGYSSDNIFSDFEFVGPRTMDGQKYDVYTLIAEYDENTAATRTNFKNINFSFTAAYEDDEGEIVETRKINLEVFRENTGDTGGNDGGDTGGNDGGDTGGNDGGDTGGNDGGDTGGNDGGTSYGSYMFWADQNFNCGSVTVTIAGVGSAQLTDYYYEGTPDCGAEGTANFTLPEGTYSFSAACSSYTWSGTITVIGGVCRKSKLYIN